MRIPPRPGNSAAQTGIRRSRGNSARCPGSSEPAPPNHCRVAGSKPTDPRCRGAAGGRRSRRWGRLRQFDRVHHRDPVGYAGDDAEVVRDQDHSGAALSADFAQQIENLRLHRNVQRRGRLIRQQQSRRACDRHRDDHALAHPAGKFVRISAKTLLGRRYSDLAEQFDRSCFGFGLGKVEVGAKHLHDLAADAHHRMQRRRWVLEDHPDAPAAQIAHGFFIERQEVDAVEIRSALQRGPRRRRISARAVVDLPQPLSPTRPRVSLSRTWNEMRSTALVRPKVDAEILDFQQLRRRRAHQSRTFGSNASRSPSPMKLKQATASVMARPGKTANHGST